MRAALIALSLAGVAARQWTKAERAAYGYEPYVRSPLPHTYVRTEDVPRAFSWGNVNGQSFLTKSLNQHIPQYCGACWAHGAVSTLADRIKVARHGRGTDVNPSVQHVLNCGNAGSCHGGDAGALFQWARTNPDGIVFDTCQPYMACSSESNEGVCPHLDTTCKPDNVCRTCSTYTEKGGYCAAIERFPNITIAEHGVLHGEEAMMKEIYARGPIACGIDANPIGNYRGGVARGACPAGSDHVVSVVGWGEENGDKFWLVRNSWGEYWGDMGFFKVSRGAGGDLCLESHCDWVTPAVWTEHDNFPCGEDGTGCGGRYRDPSSHGTPYGKLHAQL